MLIRATVTGDAEAIARVHIDTWRHTYAGVMPAEYLAGLRYDRSRRGWESFLVREGVRVFVADDPEAGVVGFASAGPNTSTGDEGGERPAYESNLYAIYVLPGWQRRGIGRALATAVVRGLLVDGRKSMIVWVLKGNPACGFYERLGGTPAGKRKETIGGAELEVIAYGWPELCRSPLAATGQ